MNFRAMHNQATPLLLCNVWDAASARVAEKLDFQAIGTSSAAVAGTLGYEDGEFLSFAELAFMVEHIARATSLPLTVDMEAGYSDAPEEIVGNIRTLAQMGVVGINLEDSKSHNGRELVDADLFGQTLATVADRLRSEGMDVFLNVRTDTYIMGLFNKALIDPLAETQRRITIYETAGADGIFVPLITEPDDIAAVTKATDLPVNVLALPQLPDFDALADLGVRRISMGSFLFDTMAKSLEKLVADIQNNRSLPSQ